MIVVLAVVTVVAMLVAAVAAFALLRPATVVPVATKPQPARAVAEEDVVGERFVEPIHSGEPSRNGIVAGGTDDAVVHDEAAAASADDESANARSGNDDATPAPPTVVRWAKRFASRDGALDDETRLNLLRDLGIVRAPWGIPLLTEAYDEETSREHRLQALSSLAAYRHIDTQPTFEAVLRDGDEDERRIAASALAALRIRAALPA
ncbi:MAG: HEAT repeat domain-containing protein [Candidatus Eremiobacteraeota bacterium]|nr:HEAT repeat domain-containing protein [Candidatus Eremiobacteraeota bacterium]MBV9408201.1 HEAT repeat domain-containing protein [Candidatus Eremiobacteraeota bacterium]